MAEGEGIPCPHTERFFFPSRPNIWDCLGLGNSQDSYVLAPGVAKPPSTTADLVETFRTEVDTSEAQSGVPFVLFLDSKSAAYYVECHINAKTAVPALDLDAAVDPEQQEEFRLQRELQPKNSAFERMCDDALRGRQFSDLIAEYDPSYRPEKPLKLLGGQHRSVALSRALTQKGVSNYHGFKVFFGLTHEQRSEIAQVANTNIAISLDILDRIQETTLGPNLRNFCHKNGLLNKNEDFADRKNPEGKLTVRLARTFIVNFVDATRYSGKLDGEVFQPYTCKTGTSDPKYRKLIEGNTVWSNKGLNEAAGEFASLHNAQVAAVEKNPELRKFAEFRNKAATISVLSSWSYAAGLLQKDRQRLLKLYSLSKTSKTDPLNAMAMSQGKHITDTDTYRGLGTRADKKDKGRLVELFLEFSRSQERGISSKLVDSAIKTYHANEAADAAQRARKKVGI